MEAVSAVACRLSFLAQWGCVAAAAPAAHCQALTDQEQIHGQLLEFERMEYVSPPTRAHKLPPNED